MKFNAHKSNKLVSRLIQFFSKGKLNHISIELDGYIYEAHIHTGVRKVHVDEWDDSTVIASQTLKISSYRKKKVKEWLDEQVGKKYDIFGVLTFVWAIFDEREGKWFCSELAKVALMKALGIDSKKVDYDQRISPSKFWSELNVIIKLL